MEPLQKLRAAPVLLLVAERGARLSASRVGSLGMSSNVTHLPRRNPGALHYQTVAHAALRSEPQAHAPCLLRHSMCDDKGGATSSRGLRSAATPQTSSMSAARIIKPDPRR